MLIYCAWRHCITCEVDWSIWNYNKFRGVISDFALDQLDELYDVLLPLKYPEISQEHSYAMRCILVQ